MQYYGCSTKGFAGNTARRAARSQGKWAEGGMRWEHHCHLQAQGTGKAVLEKGQTAMSQKYLWQLVSLGKRNRPKDKGENVMASCHLPSCPIITSKEDKDVWGSVQWFLYFKTNLRYLPKIDIYAKKCSTPWHLNLLADKHCVVPSATPY